MARVSHLPTAKSPRRFLHTQLQRSINSSVGEETTIQHREIFDHLGIEVLRVNKISDWLNVKKYRVEDVSNNILAKYYQGKTNNTLFCNSEAIIPTVARMFFVVYRISFESSWFGLP